MRSLHARGSLMGITALILVGLGSAAAGAAPAVGGTDHTSFPATGAVFVCSGPSGNLTATGGTVDSVMHWTVDGQGIYHVTGTITPRGVTLQDAKGDLYTASGASWFGGKADAAGSLIVFTDTEHWVLRDITSGGIVKVQVVDHMSPDGSFSMDRGTCSTPQG